MHTSCQGSGTHILFVLGSETNMSEKENKRKDLRIVRGVVMNVRPCFLNLFVTNLLRDIFIHTNEKFVGGEDR